MRKNKDIVFSWGCREELCLCRGALTLHVHAEVAVLHLGPRLANGGRIWTGFGEGKWWEFTPPYIHQTVFALLFQEVWWGWQKSWALRVGWQESLCGLAAWLRGPEHHGLVPAALRAVWVVGVLIMCSVQETEPLQLPEFTFSCVPWPCSTARKMACVWAGWLVGWMLCFQGESCLWHKIQGAILSCLKSRVLVAFCW